MKNYIALAAVICGLSGTSYSQNATLLNVKYTYSASPKLTVKTMAPDNDKSGKPILAGYQKHALTFAGGNGAKVPSVLYTPGNTPDGKRHAAVVLVHGIGGDKSQLAPLALMLSQKGYVVLCIDAAGHGDRPKVGNATTNLLGIASFRTIVAQTVQDLHSAIDVLIARKDVDKKRIGAGGVSFGGIVISRFLADEPRVAAGVVIAAGGNLGQLLMASQIEGAKKFRTTNKLSVAAIQQELNIIDPAKHIGRAKARPMLFLHGDKDDIVPVACNTALFNATKQPKERELMPGGHVPSPFELLTKTMVFCDKTLQGSVAK